MNPEDETESEINYEEEAESSDVDSLDEGELNPAASPHKKVVLDKADRSLSELHRWYKSGRIIMPLTGKETMSGIYLERQNSLNLSYWTSRLPLSILLKQIQGNMK